MIARIRSAVRSPLASGPQVPCTRETGQCDFGLYRGVGVRPDCCTRHLLELMDFVHALLEERGIRHWLDWGTLLGAVRDHAFIPWDSDVDFGILEEDAPAVLALRDEIERAGYAMSVDGATIQVFYSELNHASVDVYVWTRQDGLLTYRESDFMIWPGMHDRTAFPPAYLDRLERVSLHGREFWAPSPVDRFLSEHRYGPDYMTPVRPVTACGLGLPIEPDKLTPAAKELLPILRERSDVLVELVESSGLGSLARRVIPGRGKWLLIAGLPLDPDDRHVRAARALVSADAADDAVVDTLVGRLAWTESAIEEYHRPPPLLPLRRIYRRVRWFRAGLARRRNETSSNLPGYYR